MGTALGLRVCECPTPCLYHLYSAVSDRSPLQDILRIKSKLDSITKCTCALQEELTRESSIPSPTGHGAKGSFVSTLQPTGSDSKPEEPFAYSSLKDWQTVAECDHRRQLYTCEAELLDLCERLVLPRATDTCAIQTGKFEAHPSSFVHFYKVLKSA